jgi:4-amino-4-deoxychorismate lyase
MYLLVETIRIQNGTPENLEWHQQRYERSYRTLFGKNPQIVLKNAIKIPPEYRKGVVKCRFLYTADTAATEFRSYYRLKVNSLKLAEDNSIEYSHKFTDRTSINNLLKNKRDCDDILIVKNGLITDTSIANIVFFDGSGWITPAEPLLRGTARERLLSEGKISAEHITERDLMQFTHFKLINAMLEFDEQDMILISGIK